MTIDPTTDLGRIRLRIGDWADLPILPDSVINATLTDNQGSLSRTAQRCAMYILATLTSNAHKKIGILETWGSEKFENYVQFLEKTVLNPLLSDICPIPYTNATGLLENPLVQVGDDWAAGYYPGAVVIPYNVYMPLRAPIIINAPT